MSAISPNDTDVLILCGGQGTRFRKVSENIPKALALIDGKPFLDLLLNDLISQGFKRIILATGYLSDQIERHISKRKDAEYIISREFKSLGTGGAIKYAEYYFQTKQILIMNGDSYISFQFPLLLEYHKLNSADMTILLSKRDNAKDYGTVELNKSNNIISFIENKNDKNKNKVNTGIYVINRDLIINLKKDLNYSLEKELLPRWIINKKIIGMESGTSFYDIGTKDRFQIFNEIMRNGK